eukprot:COSAG02_NODE_37674_length_439_cov_0.585294_1_plen_44_part_01
MGAPETRISRHGCCSTASREENAAANYHRTTAKVRRRSERQRYV